MDPMVTQRKRADGIKDLEAPRQALTSETWTCPASLESVAMQRESPVGSQSKQF